MHRKERVRIAKVLTYVLGIRPDEFGLVPDLEGYVMVKELLQALREDPEWSFMSRAHLMELMHSQERERFDMQEGRIRAANPEHPLTPEPWDPPPPRLYHGIRRRAQPVVMRQGLKPSRGSWVIMASTRDLALRVGKRRDPEPIVLEVQAMEASRCGVRFYRTQGLLALAVYVPPEFLKGPPLPLESRMRPQEKPELRKPLELPGSFFLDLENPPSRERGIKRRDKESSWRDRKRPREGKRWSKS